jgi:hypothetical protein
VSFPIAPCAATLSIAPCQSGSGTGCRLPPLPHHPSRRYTCSAAQEGTKVSKRVKALGGYGFQLAKPGALAEVGARCCKACAKEAGCAVWRATIGNVGNVNCQFYPVGTQIVKCGSPGTPAECSDAGGSSSTRYWTGKVGKK